jgi:glycosyltransferase involved in cell wall biosynthesis
MLPIFVSLFAKKLSRYKWFFPIDTESQVVVRTNQVLNLDDPTYSGVEMSAILLWESEIKRIGFRSKLVCTTPHIKKYLIEHGSKSEIHIISQGFTPTDDSKIPPSFSSPEKLRVVYASPYIDTKGDRHYGHNMWDASTLLDEIWPKLSHNKRVELNLIGQVGQNAKKKLSQENVNMHGLVSIEECAKLLKRFDLAIYPRLIDNKWQPQKLVEYLGAGLPVIAFNLIDTEIVNREGIGGVVSNSEEFIRLVNAISKDHEKLTSWRQRCN